MADGVSSHTVAMLSALLNPKLELQWPESGLNKQQENAGCQLASQILSSHLSKPVAQGSNNGIKMGNYKRSKSWTLRFTRFTNTETPLYEGDELIHKVFTIIKNKGSWNCSACHQALHYSFIHAFTLFSIYPYIGWIPRMWKLSKLF